MAVRFPGYFGCFPLSGRLLGELGDNVGVFGCCLEVTCSEGSVSSIVEFGPESSTFGAEVEGRFMGVRVRVMVVRMGVWVVVCGVLSRR